MSTVKPNLVLKLGIASISMKISTKNNEMTLLLVVLLKFEKLRFLVTVRPNLVKNVNGLQNSSKLVKSIIK